MCCSFIKSNTTNKTNCIPQISCKSMRRKIQIHSNVTWVLSAQRCTTLDCYADVCIIAPALDTGVACITGYGAHTAPSTNPPIAPPPRPVPTSWWSIVTSVLHGIVIAEQSSRVGEPCAKGGMRQRPPLLIIWPAFKTHLTPQNPFWDSVWYHVMILVWKSDESESGLMMLEKVKWTYSDDRNWQRPLCKCH